MKKITGLVLFFVCIFSAVASAKQNPANESKTGLNAVITLKGIIVDKHTKEALAGATIQVNGKKIYSDLEGNFEIKDMERDEKCTLTISLISYKDLTLNVDLNSNKNLQIDMAQQ